MLSRSETKVFATVKNRMRVLRAERNWSQAELAGRIAVSRQAVNAIETERHEPSLAIGMRIARAFGVAVEEVFDDESGAGRG